MKRLLALRLFCAVGVIAALGSCVRVDELSDVNSLKSFAVTAHSPEAIALGVPELTENDIVIPVLYGSAKFPLTVDASVEYAGPVDLILGDDPSQSLLFETIESRKEFYVMAESGLARKYTLSLREEGYTAPEKVGMEVVSVLPAESIVYGKATVDGDYLLISLVEPTFPVTIVPRFTGEELSFEKFTNGQSTFAFEDADDTYEIIMVNDQTGVKRDFQLKINPLGVVSGGAGDYESTDLFNTDFSAALATAQEGFEIKGFRIDNSSDSISLYLSAPRTAEFPVAVSVDFGDMSETAGLIGVQNGQSLTFTDFGEPFTYFAVDPATQVARQWQIVPVRYTNPVEAVVETFRYDYLAPTLWVYGDDGNLLPSTDKRQCVTLDTSEVEIYPQSREVYLKMTKYYKALANSDWRLTLQNIDISLSDEDARVVLPEGEIYWRRNTSWQTDYNTFDVVSANGEVNTWKIWVKDFREGNPNPSSLCELTGVSLMSLMPLMATTEPSEPVSLVEDEKTIYIRLTEDDGAYPLSVMLQYEISQYARVTTQNNATEPMVFSAQDAVNEVVVTAEDGTQARWEVKLIPPVKTAGSNVTYFRADSFSSPIFKVGSVNIDEQTAEISISLNRAAIFPTVMNYSMNLSRKATASVPTNGSFEFTNMTQTAAFTVTSYDGVSKEWTVTFADHAAQLQNWTLDEWENDNTLRPAGRNGSPYWSSGNNGFVKPMSRLEVAGRGNVARLNTMTAPIVGLASGSILLGWFDAEKAPSTGQTDPVKLNYQGIEWAASRKIVALEIDVNYHSGGNGEDTGVVTIELVRQTNYDPKNYDLNARPYIFHGNRPDGEVHPDNTAVSWAKGQAILGHRSGGRVTQVVPDGEWRTIRVTPAYGGNDPLGYTHLIVQCASSSQGDTFTGEVGSTLLIDNVKLIYED